MLICLTSIQAKPNNFKPEREYIFFLRNATTRQEGWNQVRKYWSITILKDSLCKDEIIVGTRVGSRWKLKDCLALDCRYVWDSGCWQFTDGGKSLYKIKLWSDCSKYSYQIFTLWIGILVTRLLISKTFPYWINHTNCLISLLFIMI